MHTSIASETGNELNSLKFRQDFIYPHLSIGKGDRRNGGDSETLPDSKRFAREERRVFERARVDGRDRASAISLRRKLW